MNRPRRASREPAWLRKLWFPPLPVPAIKVVCVVAIVLGAALMLPALIVACIAFVSWNAMAAGYAGIWAFYWIFGAPLVALGIYAWRSASSRSGRRA